MMRDICVLCAVLLLPLASARPMRAYGGGSSRFEEKDYDADAREVNAHAVRSGAAVRQRDAEEPEPRAPQDQQPGEASQYRIVDYGGNTFLQRVRGAPAAVAGPALGDALMRKQRMDEKNEGANFGDKSDGSAPKGKYMGLGTTYNDHVNSKNVPGEIYSANIEEVEHDSDNHEVLTARNVNNRHAPRARGVFHNKPTSNNPQYSAHQLDNKIKAALMAIPQDNLEETNEKTNTNMNYHVHQSDELVNENDPVQPDYGGSEYVAPNFANGKDAEPILSRNVNSFENANVETGDYEEASIGNLESSRDRRNINEAAAPETAEAERKPQPAPSSQETNDGMSKHDESIEEKEQQAIKRHIASLSGEQMDELLSSLSPDKRELLQEIIGSDKTTQSEVVNKREITKKEGAMEVNNMNDNQQYEPNKINIQESSLNKNCKTAVSQESEMMENAKMSKQVGTNDNINVSNNKKSEEESESNNSVQESALVDVNNENPEATNEEPNLSKEQLSGDSVKSNELLKKDGSAKENEQQASFNEKFGEADKAEIKREIKFNDYGSHQYDGDENLNTNAALTNNKASENTYIQNQKRQFTNYNDQPELNQDTFQPLKRDFKNKELKTPIEEASLADQLKALEDSFPGVRSYDEGNYQLGSLKMTPLIRVKRNKREISVKKRAAGIAPDVKATYLPYRADTEDEDDDEGNEFEDDGFFDRTSNLAKDHSHILSVDKEAIKIGKNNDKNIEFKDEDSSAKETVKFSDIPSEDLPKEVENKNPSLGSDTDNVLSGADGADENLMLTSGAGIRLSRETDQDFNNIDEANGANQEFSDARRVATEELESVQNDPSGAFGGLPKTYEGELSRYKRIRRTKQQAPAA